MRHRELPSWLKDDRLFWGLQPEGEGGEGEGEGGEGEGEGEGGEGEGEEGPPEKDTYTKDEVEGLRSALKKERDNARVARRERQELAKLRKEREDADLATKGDVEKERTLREKAEARLGKLVPAWKQRAIRDAIVEEASRLKFIDPTDALIPDVLEAVEAEQDEEDPSQVNVDSSTVKRAVKALADKKKHLVDSEREGSPSGSKFGGRRDGGQKTDDEDALRKEYRI